MPSLLRSYQSSDQATVAALLHTEQASQLLPVLAQALQQASEGVLLAEQDGQLQGICFAVREAGLRYRSELALRSPHAHGLASRLLLELEARMASRGLRPLSDGSWLHSAPFYRRLVCDAPDALLQQRKVA